ncbi:MAG: glycosyltransferase family 39 protein [Chloroflexi bacterium]|nr:MAG: glycosyltransferase family 39 protein [Chloroflexota bacterium]
MARPRMTAWAAVVVGIGFAAIEAIVLNVRIRDYDEGVYWQSIRALARGEPLFSSVFASQPPAFYYALLPFDVAGHAPASLRLGVLILGLVGLAATYVIGRLLAGPIAGLVAVLLAATSPLYLHQSAVVQADGPAVAVSTVSVAFALLAVRADGRKRDLLAAATGLTFVLATGLKLLGAVTLVPLVIVLLSAGRGRTRLLVSATVGTLVGCLLMLLPVIGAPRAALDQVVLAHLRAGDPSRANLSANLKLLLLHRELPLQALAGLGVLNGLFRRNRAILVPLAWLVPSVLVRLALKRRSRGPTGPPRKRGREMLPGLAALGLMLATAAAGVIVTVRDIQLALVPDLHNAEMIAAVEAVGRPGDFWISDNPYAIAAAGRDIPGPMVDTSSQRTRAGLLTVGDLEATRVHYHVQWVLEDSFRLDGVPGYRGWLDQHFHPIQNLGGRAVIYQLNGR